MNKDFTVTIDYRNRDLQTINQRTWSFKEYTNMLSLELKRIIMDVEDAFYEFNNGKQKEEWDPQVLNDFQKIRHKLLDQANSIERLPQTLCYKGISCSSIKASELIAEVIDNANRK